MKLLSSRYKIPGFVVDTVGASNFPETTTTRLCTQEKVDSNAVLLRLHLTTRPRNSTGSDKKMGDAEQIRPASAAEVTEVCWPHLFRLGCSARTPCRHDVLRVNTQSSLDPPNLHTTDGHPMSVEYVV